MRKLFYLCLSSLVAFAAVSQVWNYGAGSLEFIRLLSIRNFNNGAVTIGTNNTASPGSYSVIFGTGNSLSGTNSFSAGSANSGSGTMAVALGDNNVVGGTKSFAQGLSNQASGGDAHASGIEAVSPLIAQFSRSSGKFAAAGDSQMSIITARMASSGAVATNLLVTGASSTFILIPANSTWAFSALIGGRTTDAGTGDEESAGYKLEGVIERDNTAAACRLVGIITKTVLAEDDVLWDANATADTTNGALTITCVGNNETAVRWVATVWLTQIGG